VSSNTAQPGDSMHTARSVIISQLRMQPPSSGSQMQRLSVAQVGSSGRSVQIGSSPVSPLELSAELELVSLGSLDALSVAEIVEVGELVIVAVADDVLASVEATLVELSSPTSSPPAGHPTTAEIVSTAGTQDLRLSLLRMGGA
jgi:hypothetical protein